jgi:serine-type D-Ala-D-Ala carboxypeptidase
MGPALDRIFGEALERRVFSGASLLVARRREICFEKCWGLTKDGGKPVDSSTRFDLASLTKPLATAVLALAAVGRSILGLDDPLSRFFPHASVPPEKRAVTVGQLLGHTSGLPAYVPFFRDLVATPFAERPGALRSMILETPLSNPPGKAACYSDLGFILLGMILESALGGPLEALFRNLRLGPGGIAPTDLHFCPLKTDCDPPQIPERLYARDYEVAATEVCPWRKRLLEGEVDDENAYCLGGVAGHAGLFGTARGVWRMLSFLWDLYTGEADGPQWRSDVLRLFWTRQAGAGATTWALGFDTPSASGSSAGRYFSPKSVGHLGFSGGSFWLDLDREVLVVLLTNRIYPTRQNEGIKLFRPLVHDTVMKALR